MIGEADEDMVARPPTEAEKEQIRQAVAQVVAGTVLQVREERYELIIHNPDKPASGQVYVDFEGYVSLCYLDWDHIGVLAGVDWAELPGTVTRERIAGVLGGL